MADGGAPSRGIPLAAFGHFASTRGVQKVTIVQRVKSGTRAMFDFWRPLRAAIVAVHRGGSRDALVELLAGLTDTRKQRVYPAFVAGYRRFLDATPAATWFDPPRFTGDIEIAPDLGLVINGVRHAVHLHFDGSPTLAHAHAAILLETMRPLCLADPALVVAVLDVRNARLWTAKGASKKGSGAVLAGELASWRAIHDALP